MEVSCRFHYFLCLNVVVAWRVPTDILFLEVPCSLHGRLMSISCRLHVGFEGVACIWFHAFSREVTHQYGKRPKAKCSQHQTCMETTWTLSDICIGHSTVVLSNCACSRIFSTRKKEQKQCKKMGLKNAIQRKANMSNARKMQMTNASLRKAKMTIAKKCEWKM